MSKAEDRDLLRRLAGVRPAGEDGEPRAAAEDDRLAALWTELDAPPAEPAPPGFAGRVMARVREEAVPVAGARPSASRGDTLTRRFGVVPARLAAASALAAGLVAGAGLGALVGPGGGEGLDGGGGPAAPFVAEPDLADGYLAALAALEEAS